MGCRNIPHDSPKQYFGLIFFVLKPTPKSPSPISRIKGGIFRKAMPENRSLLIVNEDLRASLTPKSPF